MVFSGIILFSTMAFVSYNKCKERFSDNPYKMKQLSFFAPTLEEKHDLTRVKKVSFMNFKKKVVVKVKNATAFLETLKLGEKLEGKFKFKKHNQIVLENQNGSLDTLHSMGNIIAINGDYYAISGSVNDLLEE